MVTTDSVGCRDTVIDGYNGFIVQPKDSDGLAEALKKLIEDTELRCRMGRNARQFAEERFSIKDVVNAHLRMYESLK